MGDEVCLREGRKGKLRSGGERKEGLLRVVKSEKIPWIARGKVGGRGGRFGKSP